MNVAAPEDVPMAQPEVCVITVLYDGDKSRKHALAACDFLVSQFWQHIELEFHWWRTDFLRDRHMAMAAAENAVAADFLIVSMDQDSRLAPELEAWFEMWLGQRRGPAGALVDLHPRHRRGGAESARESFLREVCRRGSFDYLSTMPGEPAGDAKPADNRTSWLTATEERGKEFKPPTHYGLNE